ncbi:MAG: UDP-3-O-acyl-N-acetylglucosamine deacetylase [Desulfobacca sp.]|uniref:UDP-3-O-acyl-N-acetylglucosamine deacetylase n=1 Tax=Desulfobacca sp. TaxID=2067990 RepID=UPI00404B7A87
MQFQQTLKRPIACQGIGIHSGRLAQVVIKPAPANSGILLVRTDLPGQPIIPARASRVVDSSLATTLGSDQASVSTVEHLLAALAGLQIDNARIEVNGPEVPILDGSAGPFVALLQKAGIKTLRWPRASFLLQRPLEIIDGDRYIRVEPAPTTKLTYSIDFPHPKIGCQQLTLIPRPRAFCREIASARTFGFLHEVQWLQANGLALGGSLENAIVLDSTDVLNPEGLRFADEFVRHKILDLIGDLALLGWPLVGHLQVHKGSHALHQKFMATLLQQQDAWRLWIPETQPAWRPSLPTSQLMRLRTAMA